jgi:propanol-preferring alcohol dehydrogenase
MRAQIFEKTGQPLRLTEIAAPVPRAQEVLVAVAYCAVCRTDLHIVDGDLENPKVPLVPGHEIVGRVVAFGEEVRNVKTGDLVGIPWLGWTCEECRFCASGRENLCSRARFTGFHIDGGYAEYALAHQRFCLPIPEGYGARAAAPLLCAGLIGYRTYRMTGDAEKLGIYGFGAAAHIVTQVARYQGRQVYAFTRPGDRAAQEFARGLGATWAGDSTERPPEEMDACMLFAPVGDLVPLALQATARGGRVVCGGIHMSDIPSFPYRLLWGEREVCSVANLTRRDGVEFMELAPRVPVRTQTQVYSLEDANRALEDLRLGKLQGAAVLEIGPG